ncbi:sulfite exporter TauE/SafE family protein [Reyranella sp. CPCC 100927]|uniref:sulfite exporter TauE/SafE family protein n=1 Tax=Reyranella sp. CPCC 100927 TaxID=2599616 RepID=UPI0011B3A51B|nr:sulfite exporter TauE/SafE family protein [Reyranella sp. CPCC 100927]TWT05929.1 sulfite exporter TauE/SafE family protein [Reyranella sp. CPCC 100927]
MDWLYPLSGFGVGVIVGMTGMGGGSLMTPLLMLVFGVPALTAVGTDLLFAAMTKSAGTAIHSRKGNVDWGVAGLLAAGSVPATVLTIWTLSQIPKQSPMMAAIISITIGIALIIAGMAIFFRRRIRDYALARADNPTQTRYAGTITVILGAILGGLVSLCSVGAGALGVAILFFLYPRLPSIRIVGSDLAHAVPLTLVAGFGHWLIGNVEWYIVGALLLGSLPGIIIGSHFANRISERFLFPVLASMLTLIGLRLIAS